MAEEIQGRKFVKDYAVKDDLVNARAKWIDNRLVVGSNMISPGCSGDLPVFYGEIIEYPAN